MPDFLPDRAEAGTLNVPGFAGLEAGLRLVSEEGPEAIGSREAALAADTARELEQLGYEVYSGPHQLGTLSFRGREDCQTLCDRLPGIALRAGLHCAPLAHKSAGTLDTGTVRVSFGRNSAPEDARALVQLLAEKPA